MAKEVPVIVEGVAEGLIERYGENPIYLEIVRAVTGRANTALRQIQN
jgi:phage shock protein PspC (stress-responsive transcriptional regulator)